MPRVANSQIESSPFCVSHDIVQPVAELRKVGYFLSIKLTT
jgi:hypothetical protein